MLTLQRKKELDELLTRIDIKVNNYDLINQALTHPSFIVEKKDEFKQNQRLEFLGDAVVDLLVGEYLYKNFVHKPEGELTRMRAALVCENALASVARKIDLGKYLLVGKGEKNSGGDKRASNLADAFEALVGALYLLVPLKEIKIMLIRELEDEIKMVHSGYYGDYKTQLQEYVQKDPNAKIKYEILKQTGPDHNKEFTAGLYIDGEFLAEGVGKTKKEAEQKSALAYLLKIGEING